MKNTRRIAFIGLFSAAALALSYLESLIPFDFAVPGIRLGLANLAVLTVLWTVDIPAGLWVNLIRILLAGMLFSSPAVLLYSLAGGLTSYGVMALCKKSSKFSILGTSIAGGVSHNLGQLAVAGAVLRSAALIGYLPFLLIAGLLTGALIGAVGAALAARMPKK